MKKKIFGLITIVLSVAMVTGCNGNASATSSVDDTQPVIIEEPTEVEPETPEPSEEVSEVVSEEKPVIEDTNGDPKLAALEVTEEFARANGLICLYRKGKLYSMGPYIPSQSTYDYFIGWKQDDDKSKLFERVFMSGASESTYADIIVFGDVPEIIIEKDDEIRDYGGVFDWIGTYEYKGYAPSITKDEDGYIVIYKYLNYVNPVRLNDQNSKTVTITASNGTIVDLNDWPNCFSKYGDYKVEWFEGMDYFEQDMGAYSKIYYSVDFGKVSNPIFTMTKEGYRIIDFSDYEPGTYAAQQVMPFTIK